MRPGRLFVVLDGCTALIPKDFNGFLQDGGRCRNRAKTIGARKNLRRMRDL
jgi:hypothetical protein